MAVFTTQGNLITENCTTRDRIGFRDVHRYFPRDNVVSIIGERCTRTIIVRLLIISRRDRRANGAGARAVIIACRIGDCLALVCNIVLCRISNGIFLAVFSLPVHSGKLNASHLVDVRGHITITVHKLIPVVRINFNPIDAIHGFCEHLIQDRFACNVQPVFIGRDLPGDLRFAILISYAVFFFNGIGIFNGYVLVVFTGHCHIRTRFDRYIISNRVLFCIEVADIISISNFILLIGTRQAIVFYRCGHSRELALDFASCSIVLQSLGCSLVLFPIRRLRTIRPAFFLAAARLRNGALLHHNFGRTKGEIIQGALCDLIHKLHITRRSLFGNNIDRVSQFSVFDAVTAVFLYTDIVLVSFPVRMLDIIRLDFKVFIGIERNLNGAVFLCRLDIQIAPEFNVPFDFAGIF